MTELPGEEIRPGWRVCPTCPPEDNVWPTEAFSAWQYATTRGRPVRPICAACLFERYPRTYKACATCGRLMFSHSKREHHASDQCRRCSSSEIPICTACGESTAGRATIDDLHVGCSIRAAAAVEAGARSDPHQDHARAA